MQRRRTIQVLELRSRWIAALRVTPSPEGSMLVESSRVERGPGPDLPIAQYAAACAPVVAALARDVFARDEPVHVLPPDGAIRSTIHRLPAVASTAVAGLLRTSYQHFVGSFATRVPVCGRTVTLASVPAGRTVVVTAVHSYARCADVELLMRTLAAAGLTQCIMVPPLLGLVELAMRQPQPPALVAEIGPDETLVMRLSAGVPDGIEKLYAGWEDWFTGHESTPAPAELAGLAERLGHPQAHVARARDATFTAIGAAARELSPTDDEQAEEPSPGPMMLAGAPAASALVMECAAARFESAVSTLDAPAPPARSTGAVPPELAPALVRLIGVAHLLTGERARIASLVEEPREPMTADRAPLRLMAKRLAAFAVAALLVATCGVLFASSVIEGDLDSMSESLKVETDTVPDPVAVQKLIVRYRDLRTREAVLDARLTCVERLLGQRVQWPAVFNAVHAATPRRTCAVVGFDVTLDWPGPDRRTAGFSLRGDAMSTDATTQFVQELRKVPSFQNVRLAGNRLTSGRAAARSIYSFEIAGDLGASHAP